MEIGRRDEVVWYCLCLKCTYSNMFVQFLLFQSWCKWQKYFYFLCFCHSERAWATTDVITYVFANVLPDFGQQGYKRAVLVNDTTGAHRHRTSEMLLEMRGFHTFRVSSGTTGEIQPNVCINTGIFITCAMFVLILFIVFQ